MGANHSWRVLLLTLLVAIGIIVACALVIVLIVGIIGGYLFHWGWTGITTKTLWDWLNLLAVLAIPVLVGFGGVVFTVRHNHDLQISRDNQRETMLQTYLDKMSDLLLHENLRNAKPGDDVANIAHARTLTVLPELDSKRKRSVIIFLARSGLINRHDWVIDMSFADLRGVDLSQPMKLDAISFEGAYLQGADLSRAELTDVKFQGANLHRANMAGTDLRGADFNYADLSGVNLRGAKVTTEQLDEAESLKGATMPDGKYNHQ